MTRTEAEKLVDAIFDDLRDRRFLKWLFDKDGERGSPILHNMHGEPLMPLAVDVQSEIREDWIKLAMST